MAPKARTAAHTEPPRGRIHDGRTPYGQSALERELGILASTPDGQKNEQLNRSAFRLAQLIPDGHLSEADIVEALERVALRIGLDTVETPATIRSGIEAGKAKPRTPRDSGPAPSSASGSGHSPHDIPGDPGPAGGPAPGNSTQPNRPDAPKNHFAEKFIVGPAINDHFLATLGQGWTIQGILPESSRLTVIFGPPGTFKSFIALNMGGCIAAGIDWHGRAVQEKFVLYVPAEGQSGTLKRLVAFQGHHCLASLQNFALLPLPCLLDRNDELMTFISAIRTLPKMPGIIFIDTLARSMSGDENSTADMGKIVLACGKISEATAAQVVLVHHTGKDEARGARGAIALTGATDSMFKTSKNGDRQVVLSCERQKDDELFPDMVFNMEVFETGFVNADGEPVRSLVPVLDPDATVTRRIGKPSITGARRIALDALKALTKHGGRAHLDDWRREAYRIGISPSTEQEAKKKAFQRAITRLLDDGLVQCTDDFYQPI